MAFRHKWKPSASQRKAFAEKMNSDPEYASEYLNRKHAKNTYSDDPRSFKHRSFIPTEFQNSQARLFIETKELTTEQRDGCNQVIYGYGCQEKIHHDYIHIVNELTRNT